MAISLPPSGCRRSAAPRARHGQIQREFGMPRVIAVADEHGRSAATPSAPSAAALNKVAIEKKITVPRSAVASTAPPSQPGRPHTPRSPGRGQHRRHGPIRRPPLEPRASAITTLSARPEAVSRSASACVGTSPITRPCAGPRGPPARTGCRSCLPRRGSPPPARCRQSQACRTTRAVSAGAPHTSSTASASGTGMSAGSTAAMERPNRIAWPSHGTCSLRPSQRASPSVMASGVRLSDARVAIRSPGARPSGESGPTSSTTPVSIPPSRSPGSASCPARRRCRAPRRASRPRGRRPCPVRSRSRPR